MGIQNQFLTLGSGQTENTQIRVFVYFWFDHFPKSKKNVERFGQYLKKYKNGFPIEISNFARKGLGFIFMLER